MRILLVGSHVASAMFILSSEDHDSIVTIVNMFPEYNTRALYHFIDICNQSYIQGAINLYNKTPWSEIKYLSKVVSATSTITTAIVDSDEITAIQKVYLMCGWLPDLVLYIYSKDYQMDLILPEIINDVQTYSINADDRHFEQNLRSLITSCALNRRHTWKTRGTD